MKTNRRFAAVCALLLALPGTDLLSAQSPTQPFAGKSSIAIYVTASGPHGAEISPDAGSIRVFVDRRAAQVVSLRDGSKDDLLYVVLVDVSQSSKEKADLIRQAAAEVFANLSGKGARGYLAAFNEQMGVSKTPLTATQTETALNKINFGGGTALYDAIRKACAVVLSGTANPSTPRRVIVLLSDGGDNSSHANARQVEQLAERDGVAIFSLGTGTGKSGEQEVLDELSRKTGGRAISSQDLNDGVLQLVQAIHEQRVLSIVSPQVRVGSLQKLAVKSAQKGVEISAPSEVLIR